MISRSNIWSATPSPQSQGKVERLIQTLKREWLGRSRFAGLAEAAAGLAAYIRGYNYDRPHHDRPHQSERKGHYVARLIMLQVS
jgi:transposase InsO family protein